MGTRRAENIDQTGYQIMHEQKHRRDKMNREDEEGTAMIVSIPLPRHQENILSPQVQLLPILPFLIPR